LNIAQLGHLITLPGHHRPEETTSTTVWGT